MTKIFYTKYEGGPILLKILFSRRSFINLLDDLESAGSTDWWSIPSTPFRKFVELFGIRIFGIKLFKINVHIIFVPTFIRNSYGIDGGIYHRWDSINGWTPTEPQDNLQELTKAVKVNKQQKGKAK